jgi:hypothetical protein
MSGRFVLGALDGVGEQVPTRGTGTGLIQQGATQESGVRMGERG